MSEPIKFDLASYKVIPIGDVLQHYGVKFRRSGPQLVADCPLPTHTSKSRNTFKANIEKNVWTCKSDSCSSAYSAQLNGKRGGDVIDLVAVKEGISALEAGKQLYRWFGRIEIRPHRATRSEEPKPNPQKNKPLSHQLKGIAYCDYLEKRGITKETADAFGVGLFPGKGSMAGRVVIPIHDSEGKLVAYAGRSITDEQPKYKLPNGFLKHLELYNFHRVEGLAETVIVVEGFFSVLWLTQCGFPDVVSLMGHSISNEQLELLDDVPTVILMLDNNEGGQEERIKTLRRLATITFVHYVPIPSQPDQLSKEELEDLLDPVLF